jgi:hypothetical protein
MIEYIELDLSIIPSLRSNRVITSRLGDIMTCFNQLRDAEMEAIDVLDFLSMRLYMHVDQFNGVERKREGVKQDSSWR